MDFPADWVILPMEGFNTAMPIYQGELIVELLVQLRNTGRVLDSFKFVLDRSAPLDITVDLACVLPIEAYQGWKLSQQFWPKDISIRRNMVSSAWVSFADSARRDCDLTDNTGAGVSAGEFIRSLALLPGNGPTNASTCWAIVIRGDNLLKLQWQALPLPASVLNGKATIKGYPHPENWSVPRTRANMSM
jgi:hypothetical protein